jgi:hypothetical protein
LSRKNIIDVFTEENQPHVVEEFIKEMTDPQRQGALELYLEQMKKKKANK